MPIIRSFTDPFLIWKWFATRKETFILRCRTICHSCWNTSTTRSGTLDKKIKLAIWRQFFITYLTPFSKSPIRPAWNSITILFGKWRHIETTIRIHHILPWLVQNGTIMPKWQFSQHRFWYAINFAMLHSFSTTSGTTWLPLAHNPFKIASNAK